MSNKSPDSTSKKCQGIMGRVGEHSVIVRKEKSGDRVAPGHSMVPEEPKSALTSRLRNLRAAFINDLHDSGSLGVRQFINTVDIDDLPDNLHTFIKVLYGDVCEFLDIPMF